MKKATSIYDIREDQVDISKKKWDDPEVRMLWAREVEKFDGAFRYWEPLLERGQKLFDYYNGKILSDEARSEYEDVLDKVVLEPRIMKGPIRALVGQIMRSRKSGQIVVEGGSYNEPVKDSAEVETINLVLKDMERKSDEKYKIRSAIHDSLVSCYPNVILFEKTHPSDHGAANGMKLRHLPWNSCCFGPITAKEPDGSDFDELFYFDFLRKSDLLDQFPEMEKQINAHFESLKNGDSDMLSSITEWDIDVDASTRDRLYDMVSLSFDNSKHSNPLIQTAMHFYPIKRTEDVWYNIFAPDDEEDFIVKPKDWTDERWSKWLDEHKDNYYGPYEKKVITLWYTIFTTSGLVLHNEKHWFQEGGDLPAAFFIPDMINGVPTGPADDMADDTLSNCIAVIEQLDELRKGSGRLFTMREGAIKNVEDLPYEVSKASGFAIVSKDFKGSNDDAFSEKVRIPNTAWKQWADSQKQDMYDNTRINETLQGASAPRQSDVAKQTEIAMALIVNAIYVDNFNRSWENCNNVKLAMIPHFYDQPDVLNIRDDEKQRDKILPINQPMGIGLDGNPESASGVVNDITSKRYRWKMSAVDDSSTAQGQQAQEALAVMNSSAGPLMKADPTGKFFAQFLMAFPNRLLNDAGKAMAEDIKMRVENSGKAEQQEILRKGQTELMKAYADLVRAQKEGKTISITGEHLAQYPNLFGVVQQWEAEIQRQIAAANQAGAGAQQQPEQQQPQEQMAVA